MENVRNLEISSPSLKPFSLWQQNTCICSVTPSTPPFVTNPLTKGSISKDTSFLPPLPKLASSAGGSCDFGPEMLHWWFPGCLLCSPGAAAHLAGTEDTKLCSLPCLWQDGSMCWAEWKRDAHRHGEVGRTAGTPCSKAEDTTSCLVQKATSWWWTVAHGWRKTIWDNLICSSWGSLWLFSYLSQSFVFPSPAAIGSSSCASDCLHFTQV